MTKDLLLTIASTYERNYNVTNKYIFFEHTVNVYSVKNGKVYNEILQRYATINDVIIDMKVSMYDEVCDYE